jgi:hypothetical protein
MKKTKKYLLRIRGTEKMIDKIFNDVCLCPEKYDKRKFIYYLIKPLTR